MDIQLQLSEFSQKFFVVTVVRWLCHFIIYEKKQLIVITNIAANSLRQTG